MGIAALLTQSVTGMPGSKPKGGLDSKLVLEAKRELWQVGLERNAMEVTSTTLLLPEEERSGMEKEPVPGLPAVKERMVLRVAMVLVPVTL